MHKILVLFLVMLFGFLVDHLYSQPYSLNKIKLWEVKGYAKSAVKQGDYNSAIYYYNYLEKKYPRKTKYLWSLAYQYHKSRNYKKAYEYFDKLVTVDKKKSLLASYYKSINAKSLGAYEEAYATLKKIKIKKKKKWMPRDFELLIENNLHGCLLAKELRDSLQTKNLIELNGSINNPHIDFNPFYISDSIFMYAAFNADTLKYYSSTDSIPKRRFYYAQKIDESWMGGKSPEVDSPFFNSIEYDTGDGVFSLDKNRFYFTQCKSNWKSKIVCHLYVTEKKDGRWLEPYQLENEINIPNYSSTEPTVGTCYDPNLEVIYFVSDRPGGYGETDIWYTIYDLVEHTYQKPVNAGIYLNTAGTETTPFYDRLNHLMYFSSDGWPSFGGLDVFYSHGDLVNWEEPYNIGYPINSQYDDLYYTENDLGIKGFFTSNRVGGVSLTHETCCDDIYEWKSSMYEKVLVKGRLLGEVMDVIELKSKLNNIKYKKIKDSLLVSNAKINLYIKKDSVNLIYISQTKTDSLGNFAFLAPLDLDYQLVVDDRRIWDKSKTFSTKDLDLNDEIYNIKDIYVKILYVGPYLLDGLFKTRNQTKLSDEDKGVIDEFLFKLMLINKEILVEIGSHTNNRGNSRQNRRLSSMRANAVVKYLVSKGVAADRLKAIGYGDTKPVVSNKKTDGKINPEDSARNLRTEFRFIDSTEL